MARKKWSARDLKDRASQYHYLKQSNIHAFIKKVLKAERKTGYTLDDTLHWNRGIEVFNDIFQTNYKFVWSQIGEADLYERTDIVSFAQQEKQFLEKHGQLRLQF